MTSLQTIMPNPIAALEEQASDDRLAREAVRSREAFAELYRRHVDSIYRYLLVRSGSEQDAQDLTTQTFMAAMDGIAGYRADGHFAAWLFGIARRINALHFRQRRPSVSLDAAAELAHPGASLEDLAAESVRLDRVIAAVQALPPDRAEAVSLRFFAGLEVREIARIMGKREPAVRMIVHRAVADLRRMLAQEDLSA